MESFSCLAVDMGAGSIRIVQGIFNDKLTLREIYRFDNQIEFIDGHDRWNLKKITEGIRYGIDKAIKESEIEIASIGVDSWGVDFVLIDKKGNPIEDPVSYRDKRTNGMKDLWDKFMTQDDTFRFTGINYNIFNSLYQLLSIKGSSQILKTDKILFIADYLNFYLSGRAVNELSLAASSQMLNCNSLQWDSKIIDFLGIESSLLSKPLKAGISLGKYRFSGKYNPDIVLVAGHDTACAVAGIPFESENSVFISTGTWCIVGILSGRPFLSAEAYKMGISNEITAEGKFRPSKNLMGLWLIQQLRLAFGSKNSYAEIEELARMETNSKFLIDTSNPIFYNPIDMRTAFDEYLLEKYNVILNSESEYYRCAYESLVESFHDTLLQFELLSGKPFECIHLVGGGSQSELLCSLLAKRIKIPVVSGPIEGAAVGNLLLQAKSMGLIKTRNQVKKILNKSFSLRQYLP